MSTPHFALPKVAIQLDKERFLCYPNRSLKRLLDEKKIDPLAGQQSMTVFDFLPPVIWAGCLWSEPNLDYAIIENYIMDEMGPLQDQALMLKVMQALTGRVQTEDDKEENPPTTTA